MTGFDPKFTITNRMTAAITQIERARGAGDSTGCFNTEIQPE